MEHLQSPARARQGEVEASNPNLDIPPFRRNEPTAARGWRDHIKVHPAADLFPLMSEPKLRELVEDIKKNKQRVQVIFWIPSGRSRACAGPPKGPSMLIDGRNRLDAMEKARLPISDKNGIPVFHWRYMEGDPYELVLSLNINRRHLDPNPTMDGAWEFAQSKGVTGHQRTVRDQYREQSGRPRVGRRRKNP